MPRGHPRVSVVIMAHPARRGFVRALRGLLDRDAEVVWDRVGNRWETGRRSLLAHVGTGSEYALTIQDDAIPCRDLVASVERATHYQGARPLALYAGSPRSAPPGFAATVADALATGNPWLLASGPHWGVAVCLPTSHIRDLVADMDRREDIPNYDARIARWYGSRRIECLYAMPSLVNHRPVAENPSLVPKRTANRRARHFIGVGASALEIDWSARPVSYVERQRFRHRRSGREVTVIADTERHRRLSRNPTWELIDGTA